MDCYGTELGGFCELDWTEQDEDGQHWNGKEERGMDGNGEVS